MNAVLKSVVLCVMLALLCGGVAVFLSPGQAHAMTGPGANGAEQIAAQVQTYVLWYDSTKTMGPWSPLCQGTYDFCRNYARGWERDGYPCQVLPQAP